MTGPYTVPPGVSRTHKGLAAPEGPNPALGRHRSHAPLRLAVGACQRGHQDPQVPPHTALSKRCVRVLQAHQERQGRPARAMEGAPGGELVFVTATGRQVDKDTVRRAFRKVTAAAGLNPREWTPRELRHTFVSVLSDNEIPIEKISDLVGHSDTTTTETIYRFQIRPVVLDGAEAMDRIFPAPEEPQER